MSATQPILPSLVPGGNISGINVSIPGSPTPQAGPSIGTTQENPLLPTSWARMTPPTMSTPGSSVPTIGGFPANTGGVPTGGAVTSGGGALGLGGTISTSDLTSGLKHLTGNRQLSTLLAEFLNSGAGFNPDVAAALIAQLQPYIERGQQDLLEQFSAYGNRFGSPAAIGLADYQSQVNLNEGQIMAQLYEQSVQNYMNVLMGLTNKTSQGSGFPTGSAIGAGSAIAVALI